jgi:hypothetical protein
MSSWEAVRGALGLEAFQVLVVAVAGYEHEGHAPASAPDVTQGFQAFEIETAGVRQDDVGPPGV